MPPPTTITSWSSVAMPVGSRHIERHLAAGTCRREPVPPKLEHHECPQQMTVIVGAGLVLSHELLDVASVEESVARQIRRAQELVHQRVPLVVQPILHRHAEALLAPLQDLLGQSRGKRLAQNPFPHS